MTDDERAIRNLVASWMAASKAGDTAKVLSLMADDVVFMTPGRAPFGKEAFAAAMQGQQPSTIDGTSDIRELKVLGDWAYIRNFIDLSITPNDGGTPIQRSGYTLTILRKDNGRWLLARDANLMMPGGG